MILKGSQRSGAVSLAVHLMKDENEHIEIHELRGFVARDLRGAFREIEAISKGTKCRQYLFSLSLNPPQQETVAIAAFERAILRAEKELGLTGQPGAVVFHEKEGRRHAHVVWSRIDAETLRAINLPHFKRKLNALSKALYLEHGWALPDGFHDKSLRDPTNFTLAEWQQAARHHRDPREIKRALRRAWESSDCKKSLQAAMRDKGFALARGDRRGFVAVDYLGGVYSLPRSTGVRTKAVKARLGDSDSLPSISQAQDKIRQAISPSLQKQRLSYLARHQDIATELKADAKAMAHRQARQRKALASQQKRRARTEHQIRQARFTHGVRGLWELVSGKRAALQKQNEREAWLAHKRD